MRSDLKKTAVLASLLAALAGCAGNKDDYPSLALRPFERGEVAQAPTPAPAPIRPATSPARLTELRNAASTAHAAFLAKEGEAGRLARAAAGQPFESNAHAAALLALAELDTQRSETAGTLAALDKLAAEAAGALSPDPALVAAQSEVAAVVASEDAAISRLWSVLER